MKLVGFCEYFMGILNEIDWYSNEIGWYSNEDQIRKKNLDPTH